VLIFSIFMQIAKTLGWEKADERITSNSKTLWIDPGTYPAEVCQLNLRQ
jgi:hypothetical protein